MTIWTFKIKLYSFIFYYTHNDFYSLNLVHADNNELFYNFIAIGGEVVDNPLIIISILLALIVGIVVGYLIRKSIAEAKISSAETLAKQIVEEAHRNADAAKNERSEEHTSELQSRGH